MKVTAIVSCFYVFFLFFTENAYSFNIPGEVPLFDISQPEARKPAVDLVYKGQILSAPALKKLEMSWVEKIKAANVGRMSEEQKEELRSSTISKLNPSPQIVQKNWINKLFLVDDGISFDEKNGLSLSRSDQIKSTFQKMDDIGVKDNDLVVFNGLTPFKDDDLYDFRVLTNDQQTGTKQFRIYLGEQAHNILLRKTILRKLGFQEQGFRYLSKVRVKFESEQRAIEMLQGCILDECKSSTLGISTNTGSNPQRWLAESYRKTIIDQRFNEETGELEDFEREVWNFPTSENGEVVLTLQDVLIHEETGVTRLSLGNLDHDRNGRRRIYNSLLLAYNLVNAPESVNSFSAVPFTIKSQKLILTHDVKYLNNFSPDIYDLKWMARRLASFSRKDFEHIVAEAHYPKEVGLLMVELLVARRNHIQKFFFANDYDCKGPLKYQSPPYYCLGESSQGSHPELSSQFKVNLKINSGKKLVAGKLKIDTRGAEFRNPDKWWVGYGSRFSYHEEESPLVMSEIFSYFRSIIQSSVLEAVIDKNINNLLKIDSNSKIIDRLRELDRRQNQYNLEHAQEVIGGNEDAKLKTIPIGFHTEPTASAQFILNRNIVIGSQQGVDNQIQLVDTFGYVLKAGFHTELEGIANLNLFSDYQEPNLGQIGLDADFTFLRRWTHLRPVKVIKVPGSEGLDGPLKKALKEDYNKMLIPKLLRDFRKEVDNIPAPREEASEEELNNYRQAIEKNYDVLNKYLKVGESLIISNTMGPSLGVRYGHRFFDINASIFMGFLMKSEDLSRVHIYRKSEKEILIYKTKANQVAWSATVGANYYVPVVSLRHYQTKGKAQTWFHKIRNMKPVETTTVVDDVVDTEINFDFQKNLTILLQTIDQDSLRDSNSFDDQNMLINKELPPYVIGHDFRQRQMDFRFLFFNHANHSTSDTIDIYSPYSHVFPQYKDGETTSYMRYSHGYRDGFDFQKVVIDVLNYVLEDKGIDGNLVLASGGDPADTLFGKSKSFTIMVDSRVTEPHPGVLADTRKVFKDPFVKLHHVWKGGVDFGLSAKKTRKLLKKVNETVSINPNFEFFNLEDFARVERLQLYRVGVDIIIFKEGIEKLLSYSRHELVRKFERKRRKIFDAMKSSEQIKLEYDQDSLGVRMEYGRVLNAYEEGDPQKISKYLVRLINKLQQDMEFIDFISLFDEVPHDKDIVKKPLRNVYVKGIVNGFKLGDEKLDPILSNEIGFPRKKTVNGRTYDYTYGDLELIKNRIGINNNEFYLNWILRAYL